MGSLLECVTSTHDPPTFSLQLCNHIASGKKCQYVGNCSFAHSPEERDVWTYMKENGSKSIGALLHGWMLG